MRYDNRGVENAGTAGRLEMTRIKFNRPRRANSWPWWIIGLSGLLVAMLAATLLVGSLGGCRSPRANALTGVGELRTARCAHIAQASAAASSGAGLVFGGCMARHWRVD
jgi:hypothetical protein